MKKQSKNEIRTEFFSSIITKIERLVIPPLVAFLISQGVSAPYGMWIVVIVLVLWGISVPHTLPPGQLTPQPVNLKNGNLS